MPSAPVPECEPYRLQALYRYEILDTPTEMAFDRIASLAARLFEMPMGLVSLVDQDRQWLKARCGIDVEQTGRDEAFCAYTILSNNVLVVEDACLDVRFFDNPLVAGPPYIRSYAGAPLNTSDGFRIGSLCVIDTKPRTFSHEEIATLTDLAALVVSELELRRSSKDLQVRNWELAEARDAALDVARVKSEFLANMSHEIRTPMNGVMGILELLSDTPLNTQQTKFMQIMKLSTQSLMTIVNDILDFSNIESKQVVIQKTEFSLIALLQDIASGQSLKAQVKNITLRCLNASGNDWVGHYLGDPERLRQIITHLTDNAIKFTPSGGEITLSAQIISETAHHANWMIVVEDTGIGISEDHQEPIFECFRQADGSMKRRHGGIGLGLTICRQLVTLMGGKIGVTSEVGKGSTFWIEAPFEKAMC